MTNAETHKIVVYARLGDEFNCAPFSGVAEGQGRDFNVRVKPMGSGGRSAYVTISAEVPAPNKDAAITKLMAALDRAKPYLFHIGEGENRAPVYSGDFATFCHTAKPPEHVIKSALVAEAQTRHIIPEPHTPHAIVLVVGNQYRAA